MKIMGRSTETYIEKRLRVAGLKGGGEGMT